MKALTAKHREALALAIGAAQVAAEARRANRAHKWTPEIGHEGDRFEEWRTETARLARVQTDAEMRADAAMRKALAALPKDAPARIRGAQ